MDVDLDLKKKLYQESEDGKYFRTNYNCTLILRSISIRRIKK